MKIRNNESQINNFIYIIKKLFIHVLYVYLFSGIHILAKLALNLVH